MSFGFKYYTNFAAGAFEIKLIEDILDIVGFQPLSAFRPRYKDFGRGLFLAQKITQQRFKYGYDYKMEIYRLKQQRILLPSTKENEPD